MNTLSKEKQSSLIAALENLWISASVLHCSTVSTLLWRYLLRRSNIMRLFEKSLSFLRRKEKQRRGAFG